MQRRDFLSSSAALGATMLGGYFVNGQDQKTRRVGLIGCGWYGKSDICRLIQVAPVEVVSLCDVDKHMLSGAADLVASRQPSKKQPRTFADYREMLKEKDLDIVLVGTPDHWHALTAIAAMESGADVYVQKPISVDVAEGAAMVAAARRLNRVVQVGTQRKSTPHLVECKKNVIDAGLLGKIAHAELCCYYHMRANGNPDVISPPDYLDYEMWTGPAPLRPYDSPPNPNHDNARVPHRRWWRTFTEYGNGIMGDMCIHMLDTVRWMLNIGWPKSIESTGGIYVQKEGKSNISDTQVATFEYPELNVVWTHRSWGNPPDSKYPWALTLHGEKGMLKASTMSYDFYPTGKNEPSIHKDVIYEREQYPEDLTEKDIELHAAPATRAHMRDFLAAIDSRGRPIADIEQGHISTASCILANLSMKLNRPLVWDAAKGQVASDAEANRLLLRPYRQPWKHPAS
ncbi:MAG TPA: Gfo/Idh/MocA family oxidoreductase [Pirellulaceae bacterium]